MTARKPPPIPSAERTPLARLSESHLRRILGYQLAQAGIVTDGVFEATVGRPLKLRRIEFTILALLHGNPGATARQLARALAVTPPNIAVVLERLESRRLLVRERSATDGRMQHIGLTGRGAALAEKASRAIVDGERSAFGTLSSTEFAMLLELLHKAAQARRTPAVSG